MWQWIHQKCFLYKIFGLFKKWFWTLCFFNQIKNVFPLSRNLICELFHCLCDELLDKTKQNSWINQKKIIILVYYHVFWLNKITDVFHTLVATKCKLCWEVKWFLEIHPLNALVRTSLYYCQNIRKTVWDKYVLLVENVTHFTATWMCSINYKNTYKRIQL